MPTLLITGANRGLGLEFVRQYAADGWRVIAACRNPAKATALRALGSAVTIHPLDVADFKAVSALGRELRSETIDLLIANAGVLLARDMTPQAVDDAAWMESFRVNAMAPIAVAGAFLDQVRRGPGKRLIAITSQLGSIENTTGGLYTYRTSKAALNAGWRTLAQDNPDLIAVVLHPGWVRTDMGGPQAALEPKDSISGMRRVIAGLTPDKSGRFLAYDSSPIPW